MPEEEKNIKNQEKQIESETPPSAETQKPETQEHMIPKSRLDEEISKRKALEDRLSALEVSAKELEEKRLEEQEKWQELAQKRQQEIEALRPKASVAEEQEKSLQAFLNAQIEEIPENMRSLIPEQLTTMQKLNWLATNRSLLTKPVGPDIGAGTRGAGSSGAVKLTPEEQQVARMFGYSDEEYAKNKDTMPNI